MKPQYRADIDGLRAIAILSVLFFHLGVETVSGGFVGVDIFFVISGYLITTIITREINAGEFKLSTFYERRFRRILPAALVVGATTLLVGYFLLDFVAYKELAESLVSSNLFVSNFFFYLRTGYFDGPAELKPMLHTWSLAVEEQYYLIFPLLLVWFARRFNRPFSLEITILFIGSLVLSVVLLPRDPSAVFYHLPMRAWELLTGSILALMRRPSPSDSAALANLMSLAGLALILFSVFGYDDTTPFPGQYALPPVIGTAMLIYSGNYSSSLVNRLLSLSPVVFIGLISYSLYLWHWPAIAITNYYFPDGASIQLRLVLLVAVFLLAIVSWRIVERPFRRKQLLASRRSLFIGSFLATAILIGASFIVIELNGLPKRGEIPQSADVLAGDPEWSRWAHCEGIAKKLDENRPFCTLGDRQASATFFLWGDSHARALATAIDVSAARQGVQGRIATRGGCPPLLGIDRKGQSECGEFNDYVLNQIAHDEDIETVLLVARWALSSTGVRYKAEIGKTVTLHDNLSPQETDADNNRLLEIGLRRTIDELQALGKSVVLVTQVPEIGYDVPATQHKAALIGHDVDSLIAPSREEYLQRNSDVIAIFARLNKDYSIQIISADEVLCNEQKCTTVLPDGIAIYRDDDHLSTAGSRHLSSLFDTIFTNVR